MAQQNLDLTCRPLWKEIFKIAIPLQLAVFVASNDAGLAQQVVYGHGPSPFGVSSFSNPAGFSIDPGVNCPTPSINLTGFGGRVNDWAGNVAPYAASNSTTGNYGILAGVNIPLGGDIGRFCRDYAASRTMYERKRVENQLINSQLMLIKNCYYLHSKGIRLKDKAFNDQFPELSACSKILSALPAPNPAGGTAGEMSAPKELDVEKATQIQLTYPVGP